jgi:hypothetical protein
MLLPLEQLLRHLIADTGGAMNTRTQSPWVNALILGSLAAACSEGSPDDRSPAAGQVEAALSIELLGGPSPLREKWLGDSAIAIRGTPAEVAAQNDEVTRQLSELAQVAGPRVSRFELGDRSLELSEPALRRVGPMLKHALRRAPPPSTGRPANAGSTGDPSVGCSRQELRAVACCIGFVAYCIEHDDHVDGSGCLWCCE